MFASARTGQGLFKCLLLTCMGDAGCSGAAGKAKLRARPAGSSGAGCTIGMCICDEQPHGKRFS